MSVEWNIGVSGRDLCRLTVRISGSSGVEKTDRPKIDTLYADTMMSRGTDGFSVWGSINRGRAGSSVRHGHETFAELPESSFKRHKPFGLASDGNGLFYWYDAISAPQVGFFSR